MSLSPLSSETLHATAVAIGGLAVLIEGRSGSGKSDLALRLIDRGAMLIADDRTIVRRHDGRLLASAPPAIAGRIEVRGVGIVALPHRDDVPVAMIVTLDEVAARLPEPMHRVVAGVAVPVAAIAGFEASAPMKIGHLLDRIGA